MIWIMIGDVPIRTRDLRVDDFYETTHARGVPSGIMTPERRHHMNQVTTKIRRKLKLQRRRK